MPWNVAPWSWCSVHDTPMIMTREVVVTAADIEQGHQRLVEVIRVRWKLPELL